MLNVKGSDIFKNKVLGFLYRYGDTKEISAECKKYVKKCYDDFNFFYNLLHHLH